MFKDIIVITGIARSGTSWLGQIIDSSPDVAYRYQPIFSYAFKDAVNIESSTKDYEYFFDGIYNSADDFLLQTAQRKEGIYPTFEKKNNPKYLAFKTCRYQYLIVKMLKKIDNLKVIHIVRHPCGSINSWLKSPKEFPAGSYPRKEWRFGTCKNEGRPEHFYGFYKWKEVTHLHLDLQDKYPDQVYIVKYEDLVDNPVLYTERIFDFTGLEYTKQTETFLNTCHSFHNQDVFSVFKTPDVKERWKSELDPYIANEIIDDITGTRLARFL